ncbi:High mobility group protein DSP1 [Nymphon striatum]|nr:High mobility group protein DSP1 [Nymphon striatum]
MLSFCVNKRNIKISLGEFTGIKEKKSQSNKKLTQIRIAISYIKTVDNNRMSQQKSSSNQNNKCKSKLNESHRVLYRCSIQSFDFVVSEPSGFTRCTKPASVVQTLANWMQTKSTTTGFSLGTGRRLKRLLQNKLTPVQIDKKIFSRNLKLFETVNLAGSRFLRETLLYHDQNSPECTISHLEIKIFLGGGMLLPLTNMVAISSDYETCLKIYIVETFTKRHIYCICTEYRLFYFKMGKRAVKDANKPKGKMSAYAYFVQICREEHKKKNGDEKVSFAKFSKKCSERWRSMNDKEKGRFRDMADNDKKRYDEEMKSYVPPKGEKGKKRKRTKDPNAPKRSLSAFFFFCNEERGAIKAAHPEHGVGDIAKELGKMWNQVDETTKSKFEAKAAKDKLRYEAVSFLSLNLY